jgi:hypothetical protein
MRLYPARLLLLIAFFLLWIFPWFDYFDLGIWHGINVFQREKDLDAVVDWFVGFPIIITLYLSIQALREQQRQRENNMRPYLRLAWDSRYMGEDRLSEGVTNSCLIAVNEGKGHMRNVIYNARVGETEVALRRHEFISAGAATSIVYDDLSNQAGPALGNRNDVSFPARNAEIIKKDAIKIWGTYQDWAGKATYEFQFISDPTSQSGLSEPSVQDRIR